MLSSDHFYPWSSEQGQSGFAWSWLGAALQATNVISFGVVNAPGQRYHPAIIAQGAATLAEMFPERFWIAIGSGPEKAERNARMKVAADVMLNLWAGKTVNTNNFAKTESAKLYTLPSQRPLLIGAALSEEKATFIAPWADGMITISDKPERVKKVIEAFRSHGGEGKPVYLKVQLSYAKKLSDARIAAYLQWRNNCLAKDMQEDLRTPEDFDIAGVNVPSATVEEKVLIGSDPNQFTDWFESFRALGVERLYLHNVNRNQQEFIEDFGEHVLPKFIY